MSSTFTIATSSNTKVGDLVVIQFRSVIDGEWAPLEACRLRRVSEVRRVRITVGETAMLRHACFTAWGESIHGEARLVHAPR